MKRITNIKVFILLMLYFSVSVAEIKIDYPDLSDAKSGIKKRQVELYDKLINDKKTKTGYQLAESYGQLGYFYHAHDYPETAIQLYLNAVELAPKNSKWHYILAMAYRANGHFKKAETSFFTSWQYNDGYLPTIVYLAEIYMQNGEFDKAKEYYNKALEKDKSYPRALVGYGQIQIQLGETESAIEKFKRALVLQPRANQINFLLSQAYASLGNMQEAQKYNKAKGTTQAQMHDPLFLRMLKETRSSTYYNDKAVAAYYNKDYRASEIYAKQAIEYDIDSPYPYVTLANIYVATKRADEASKILQKVVVENNQNPNLKYSLGVIEEILGNNDNAIYWYKKVLELDPGYVKASITLSSALMRKDEFNKALIELERAHKLDATNSFVIHKQAAIYAHQNKCGLAQEKIYQAVKSQPKNFAFLLTFVKIAVHCQVSEQMLSDALNAARNMYNISQDDYVVKTLAMIEAKSGKFKNAIDFQAQVIFNLLSNQSQSGKPVGNKNQMEKLKYDLSLYKQNKYPIDLFTKMDIDLNPKSFTKLR